jgi:protoporphyrinogen/coproporphyrinogen III oxidase
MRDSVRFVVVGAGISGLAAANRICELSVERGEQPSVVVLEASGCAGGLIRTEQVDGMLLEAGADSFLLGKPGGAELCERLGLGAELVRIDAAVGAARILFRGRLHEIPRGFLMMAPTQVWPLLRSSLFSAPAKLRMILERFIPPSNGGADESLASFVSRRFGRQALERVAEPVLASLFMADAETLSMAAALPRFVEMEQVAGSVTRGLHRALASPGRPHGGAGFAYLRRGMGALVGRLLERLPARSLRTGARLGTVAPAGRGRWRLSLGNGDVVGAESVVLACPADEIADVLEPLDGELAAEVGRLAYCSCAIVNLAYHAADIRRPLPGFGFFVPRGEGLPLLAASFASLKFPERAREGEVWIRCFLGGALHPHLAERSEEELAELAHGELRRLLGVVSEPRLARTFRLPRAMPQYEVGFPEHARALTARLGAHRGLEIAGSAVGAVGLPDCIRSGERAAERAFAQVGEVSASALSARA